MKKALLGIILAFLFVGSVHAYQIKEGDTLSKIAKEHNTTVEELVFVNNIENPDLIYAGSYLKINDELNEMLGTALPVDNYDTFLTGPLSASATSVSVNEIPDGVTESIYTLFASDGTTPREKIYCTGASGSTLTGCVRGVSFSPVSGVIDESAGTGLSHSKNTRIAITDNINFSGKALAILAGNQKTSSTEFIFGDSSTTTDKFFYFCDSTSTSTCGFIYAIASSTDDTKQTLGWSPDGTNTFTFSEGSSGLTAGTAILINNSKINLNFTATSSGFGIDNLGELIFTTTTSNGLLVNADGLAINTSTPHTWTGLNNWTATTTFTTTTADEITSASSTISQLNSETVTSTVVDAGTLCLSGANCITSLGFSQLISVEAKSVTVANNTNELSIASTTIPANLLGTDNGIKFSVYISEFKLLGASSMKLIVKYGNTDVGTFTLTEAQTANIDAIKGKIEGVLFATGATNTQYGDISAHFAPSYAGGNSSATWPADVFWGQDYGTSAEDSTGALTLDIKVDFGSASADSSITAQSIVVEGLRN